MLRFPAGTPVYVMHDKVDFRKGIASLGGVCRSLLQKNPEKDGVFVFRNRASTALKILWFDSQGYCMLHKALANSKFKHWPKGTELTTELIVQELDVLLFNGDPLSVSFGEKWP